MMSLEAQVNAALQSWVPSEIVNPRHRLAMELHLIPYYGAPSEQSAPYIYRSKAKAGTTRFLPMPPCMSSNVISGSPWRCMPSLTVKPW